MRGRLRGLVLLMAFGLGGCATLNDHQCKHIDWRALGLRDALAGYPRSRLQQHVEACEFHKLPVNRERYLAGYGHGLERYCRLDNAFEVGLAGRSYLGICPAAVDRDFRRNHAAGYAVHRIESQIRSAQYSIGHKEDALIESDELTPKQRKRLREEINRLDREVRRLRDELYHAEETLDRLRRGG